MNSTLATYAVTPVELKGVRCKISKVNEGESRQRRSLFGWRKCSDSSTVSGYEDEDESKDSYPSMRAVVWHQQDKILSFPMEVISKDEYGRMIMNCVWPDGDKLYVTNVSNEEKVTLRLGIQVQNEAMISIGTARVSSTGCDSTFLIFLPIEQSDQVGDDRYEFDVSSSKLSTVMDTADANLSNFFVNQSMPFLSPNAESSGALISDNGTTTTTSEYVENDWKLWETDDVENSKFDDFSFQPVFEDVSAASVEQGEQANLMEAVKKLEIDEVKTAIDDARSDYSSSLVIVEEVTGENGENGENKTLGVEDESKPKDCFDDTLRPSCLSEKGEQPNANEDLIEYPTSLIKFKSETGEVDQVEFTNDAVPRKSTATRYLDRLLKRKAREKKASAQSVTTASTCSSSSSEAFYNVACSDSTVEEDVSRGCCSTFSEILDIISSRDRLQENFALCLEELLDADSCLCADDDYSFVSEANNNSVKSKRGKSVRARRNYLVKEDEFMKHKQVFAKTVEL